jgi:hypothetical protein
MVPVENIRMFVLDHKEALGIEGRTSEIIEKARGESDRGLVPWSRFANLLGKGGKELSALFLKECNEQRHREVMREAWRKK